MDREGEGNLHQGLIPQFFFYELADDTGHAQADLGKFNEQIHGGHFQQVVCLNVVHGEVVIYILAGHIFLVQQHQSGCVEDIVLVVGAQGQIVQVGTGADENVLNFPERIKMYVVKPFRFPDKPQINFVFL